MLATQHPLSVLIPLLACPKDRATLHLKEEQLICDSCGQGYAVVDSIPVFLTEEDKSRRPQRGTELFETNAEYFERLHTKRLNEWRKVPYLSETFTTKDQWALDIGSGGGTLTLSLAKRGVDAVGLDISVHGARRGLQNARQLGLSNCFFVVGDAVHLPFGTNQFNLVTNYTTIEHLYNPDGCLAEMQRVVSPQGRVLVNTINNTAIRLEKGLGLALKDFSRELKDYLRSVLRGKPVTPPEGKSPEEITYETWKSGEESDLYHARSYDLLHRTRRFFDILFYTSHSYSHDATEHLLTQDLSVQKRNLPWIKRMLYCVLTLLDYVPGLRHFGTTITLIGKKRPLP